MISTSIFYIYISTSTFLDDIEQVKLFTDAQNPPHSHDFADRDMARFRFDYVDIRQRKKQS